MVYGKQTQTDPNRPENHGDPSPLFFNISTVFFSPMNSGKNRQILCLVCLVSLEQTRGDPSSKTSNKEEGKGFRKCRVQIALSEITKSTQIHPHKRRYKSSKEMRSSKQRFGTRCGFVEGESGRIPLVFFPRRYSNTLFCSMSSKQIGRPSF